MKKLGILTLELGYDELAGEKYLEISFRNNDGISDGYSCLKWDNTLDESDFIIGMIENAIPIINANWLVVNDELETLLIKNAVKMYSDFDADLHHKISREFLIYDTDKRSYFDD